ncbi:hypothetical protein P3X46_003034 [Hevea brasiliensis]|uniref:Germin-like protein n=1 Tax=Hevea brasiliensis TaxID=3981 RepID=A0ABQ9N8P2_HEVBR|nr:hypothetical protein P3X46_003034 [Hevea brasiliensis]
MKTTSSMPHVFRALDLLLGLAEPDPDSPQDYCIADTKLSFYLNGVPCINPNLATTAHFTTSALAKAGNTRANPIGFNVTLTTVANLPGINTLGLFLARVDIAANGIVPPHSNPRASEVTICLKGSILVGFVDTSNRLYSQQLRAGESFVFPKGLILFLSQNPGAQIASIAAFTSNPHIPDDVVKKAFQITTQEVVKIRKNLGG